MPDSRPSVSIQHLIHRIIALRTEGTQITLFAACPNSDAVLEAAVKVAQSNNMPMLLAATLNQVDRDGGYTGWTPKAFVDRTKALVAKHHCTAPVYPCLDHGGPWLKDTHTLAGLSLEETMAEVRATLTACLEAGYALLHIDPTVDRTLPAGEAPPIELVVERTAQLIAYSESERVRLSLPPVSYEVGTEEVHGGLVDMDNFDRFLAGLRDRLQGMNLDRAWPCFVVGKVGTDLHTTTFDPESARRLFDRVAPLGSLVKGHYTDWVANPAAYPKAGMGGANVGPEFTAEELAGLEELCECEGRLGLRDPELSGFRAALESAVVDSNRWKKWLIGDEVGRSFEQLTSARREWLIATGARYVWTDARVLDARKRLYHNVRGEYRDPNAFVVDRIAMTMQHYVDAFNLKDSLPLLTEPGNSGNR